MATSRSRWERLPGLYKAWLGALSCFVLAGLTGALFRFIPLTGIDTGLSLVNVRHAHSHLMYFGWVTPALMILVGGHLPFLTGRDVHRSLYWIVASGFVTALLSYPPFLLFGYAPAVFGETRLPLSVIAAGLNVVVWYAFVVYYIRQTKGIRRGSALLVWDFAMIFLVLATLGAWALALMKPLGIENVVLSVAFTHVFLDLFSEGWFVLGVLGLVYATVDQELNRWTRIGLVLICLGLPTLFAFGMAASLVPAPLKLLARAGGVLVSTGLLIQVGVLAGRLMRERSAWLIPLGMLGVKAAGQLGAALLPGVWLVNLPGMRILYLHIMLLGFVTLGLFAASVALWRRGEGLRSFVYGTVLLLIISLIPLSVLWPSAWKGPWVNVFAAWAALLPTLFVAGFLIQNLLQRSRGLPRSPDTELHMKSEPPDWQIKIKETKPERVSPIIRG